MEHMVTLILVWRSHRLPGEYCAKDKAMSREQYYLDNLAHEYNILPTAGSRLGSQHSETAKGKIREAWQDSAMQEIWQAAAAAGAAALIFLKKK
jgi:hypothetical protein